MLHIIVVYIEECELDILLLCRQSWVQHYQPCTALYSPVHTTSPADLCTTMTPPPSPFPSPTKQRYLSQIPVLCLQPCSTLILAPHRGLRLNNTFVSSIRSTIVQVRLILFTSPNGGVFVEPYHSFKTRLD